jgi:hypothetical protein
VANELVKQLVDWTKPGLDEHTSRKPRYDESYAIYRAVTKRPAGAEPWQSKLRVPYGMQVIDTAMVNIVSGKPRVIVRPRNPESEASAKAMQKLLDYYIDEDHLVEKQPGFVQQGLIFGTTIAKNHWLYRTCVRPMKVGAGEPQMVEYVEQDGPTFEPWDIYDAWWDPDGRDVDSARYVVLRSWVSKDDLLRDAVNEDAGTGVYHNVEQAIKTGPKTADSTKQSERNQGEKKKQKYELWEVWRDTPQGLRVTVICNREVALRDDYSPYWHGKKPIVIAQARPDLFDIAGIPETELVDHLQQALWTLQNMRVDNLHLTVQRGITYREGGVLDPAQLELRPRFKWPVQDHDDIQFQQPPPLPPEAYREDERMLSQMQLVTGINPYISGAEGAGVDQTTATGVTALQEVASRLLRFKAAQIANKGYQRTYEQWSEMIQQLLDKDVAIRIEGAGNIVTWEHYGPQDIIGSYDVRLEGSEESLSRQQERNEALALLNAFAPLAQAGVNLKPVLERVAAAYNFPNPEALLAPPQPAAPMEQPPANGAAPPGTGLEGGAPPGQLLGGQRIDPRILNVIQEGR